jgi:uncharacterized protein
MQQTTLPAMAPSPDERTWASLAHISILLAVLSAGPLGPLAAFIIWLAKQDKSPYVRRQAMQALIFQMVAIAVTWGMWLIIGLLSVVLIGLCCIPVGLLVSLLLVVYGCYGGYECSQGRDFSYWLIGDLIS